MAVDPTRLDATRRVPGRGRPGRDPATPRPALALSSARGGRAAPGGDSAAGGVLRRHLSAGAGAGGRPDARRPGNAAVRGAGRGRRVSDGGGGPHAPRRPARLRAAGGRARLVAEPGASVLCPRPSRPDLAGIHRGDLRARKPRGLSLQLRPASGPGELPRAHREHGRQRRRAPRRPARVHEPRSARSARLRAGGGRRRRARARSLPPGRSRARRRAHAAEDRHRFAPAARRGALPQPRRQGPRHGGVGDADGLRRRARDDRDRARRERAPTDGVAAHDER